MLNKLKKLFSRKTEDPYPAICMWPELQRRALENARANPRSRPEEKRTETNPTPLPSSILRYFETDEWAEIEKLTLDELIEMIGKASPRT
jgi:hypothetical protein